MWRSRLLFLFALVAALVTAVLYEDVRISFLALYSLLLLLLASGVTAAAAPLCVRVSVQAERDYLFKSEVLEYRVQIVNRGIFPYHVIKCTYHNPDLMRYQGDPVGAGIGPRVRRGRVCKVGFPYRGIYQLGVKKIVLTDFLGIFRISVPISDPLSVAVYPASDDSFSLTMRNESQNAAFNYERSNEDYTEIADTRKYNPSDSYRNIHWKLSAKRGELIVKTYPSKIQNKTALFLDTKKLPLTGEQRAAFEDKMVSYVASAMNYCIARRMQSHFVFGEHLEDQKQVWPLDDRNRLFRLLSRVAFTREDSCFSTFSANLDQSMGSYNLLVFLWDIDPLIYDYMKGLNAFDNNIFIYLFHSAKVPLTDEKSFYLDSLKTLGAAVNRVQVDE